MIKMKTFTDVRKNKTITKLIGGIKVSFQPVDNGVVVMIDGDKLDTYPSMSLAMNAANEFIKQYKGMK